MKISSIFNMFGLRRPSDFKPPAINEGDVSGRASRSGSEASQVSSSWSGQQSGQQGGHPGWNGQQAGTGQDSWNGQQGGHPHQAGTGQQGGQDSWNGNGPGWPCRSVSSSRAASSEPDKGAAFQAFANNSHKEQRDQDLRQQLQQGSDSRDRPVCQTVFPSSLKLEQDKSLSRASPANFSNNGVNYSSRGVTPTNYSIPGVAPVSFPITSSRGVTPVSYSIPEHEPASFDSYHYPEEDDEHYLEEEVFFHPPAMSNQRAPQRPPPPMNRPPSMSRPAPPGMVPPPVPASPHLTRKISAPANFANPRTMAMSPGNTPQYSMSPGPVPQSSAMFKRPPDSMDVNKISKFGEARVRSPSPGQGHMPRPGPMSNGPQSGMASPQRRTSTSSNGSGPSHAPTQLPYNMNGSGHGDMQSFLSLLECEKADFVDQVQKSKSFIQGVIKDKEELGGIVANQQKKITKLEGQKMDFQKKFIEAEREKRDFHERIEQERQNGIQSIKKAEKFKRDYEKIQQDSLEIAKERNEAVNKLTKEMKELERIEGERKDLFNRIDTLEREKSENMSKNSTDQMSKNVSDLNMKLKMQIGDYRLENEKLLKDNDQMNTKANSWEHQLQAANRSMRENEDLVREKEQQIESLTEEAMQMKTQILTFQEDAKGRMSSDSDLKKENVKFKVDQAAALNKITKYQKDFEKVESDRKEGLHKIQALNIEMKQMRMKLEEFEANKAADVKRLEASLTESLKSNKKVADNLNQEKEIIAQMENHKESLEEEIEKLNIENRNIQSECKKHASTIENKKKLENELESMVSDLKDKVEKFEDEKKAIAKAERMRKTSVASQKNEEKKEWEEKLEKAKIQFDRASVEGKKNMARLEEENNKATAYIEDVKTQLEKKEVECRGLNTKLGSMDKEFKRYKTWAQEKSDTYEKTIEDMEGRVSEGRRNMEQWKRKHDNIVNDLESANKFKDSLNETIQTLNAEIENMREQNSGNISLIELEKDKVEEKVKEKDQSIKELQNEKAALQRKSEQQVKDLNSRIGSLKDEVNKSSDEKDELMKRFESLSTEKDKSSDEKLNIKNNEIKAKERELVDFKQVAEIKEKKLLGDIEREKEDKSKIQTTLKAEIDELKSDVSKKQGDITKLEKEKREVTVSRDKTAKKMDEIEKERAKLKECLAKIEEEKKKNNFGKYEKDKMKTDIDKLSEEKQALKTRCDTLNTDKRALDDRIIELNQVEVLKQELSEKNEELYTTVSDLREKCKELEDTCKQSNSNSSDELKSTNEKLKSITYEKEKQQVQIVKLEKQAKEQTVQINTYKGEISLTKKSRDSAEERIKVLEKGDSKSKVLSEKITTLEKDKYERDQKINSFDAKIQGLEEEKKALDLTVTKLEQGKAEISKKLSECENEIKNSAKSGNSANKSELTKIKKEYQAVKKEKDDLGKSMKVIEKDIKKHLSNIKPAKIQTDMKKLVESIENNSLIPRNEAEENSTKELLEKTDQFESVKNNFDRLQADFETKSTEMEGLTSQLTRSKSDCNSAVEKLRKSESDLGQIKEKNAQLSDELLNQSRKITILENTVPSSTVTTANGNNSNKSKEIEDLENKVKELTKKLCESEKASKPKKSVKFNADPVTEPPVDNLKELESALEKAYLERNEILKSCKEEVEFHRTIASELETSILEDFEWKLHEIEKDYNSRLKHAREDIDEQIKEATSAIMMEKNEEIQKMRIQLKKEMEKNGMKSGDTDKAIDSASKDGMSKDEKKKMKKEIEKLKKQLKDKKAPANPGNSSDLDKILFDERCKFEKESKRFQDDHEKLRDSLNGEMGRLRADYDEKIEDYESRLEKALSDKVEKMIALKEEVEVEYADRMEELREMYKGELITQTERTDKEKAKYQELEQSLQESLRTKRQECDQLTATSNEAVKNIEDLERRLNNQTAEVIRLMQELENFEYQDAQ